MVFGNVWEGCTVNVFGSTHGVLRAKRLYCNWVRHVATPLFSQPHSVLSPSPSVPLSTCSQSVAKHQVKQHHGSSLPSLKLLTVLCFDLTDKLAPVLCPTVRDTSWPPTAVRDLQLPIPPSRHPPAYMYLHVHPCRSAAVD